MNFIMTVKVLHISHNRSGMLSLPLPLMWKIWKTFYGFFIHRVEGEIYAKR
jgi:hypothetical protein